MNNFYKILSGKFHIPSAEPNITEDDAKAAYNAIKEGRLSSGSYVKKFEQEFANYIGTKFAIAVNSATSGLQLALASLDIYGGEVITTPFTYAATSNVIVHQNAKPVFVDVEKETYNIDPDKIEKAITKKTRAIFLVHLLGNPCNMTKIQKIAKKHDLQIIEDACEAHGAEFNGKKVGTFGVLSTFSFFASHHITTMEGGMVVTNSEELYELGKSIRTFGWSRNLKNEEYFKKTNPNVDSRFLFVNIGYNLRPTEIQGAFGIHQIRKLDKLVKIKIKNAKYWNSKLKKYTNLFILPISNKKYKNDKK